MTTRPTRRQPDIPEASRTPVSARDDPTMSSHPTPGPAYTTTPAPMTPLRGRPANRYPDTLGRVPLHRRGTSKTYERLEDLLREAGYKDTRVFTPETDRSARSATEKPDAIAGNSVRGSVGAVVDFITGLVSRGSSLARETAPLEDSAAQSDAPAWSPPSPLDHALHIKNGKAKRVSSRTSLSRNGSSESVRPLTCVDLSADASHRTPSPQAVQRHQSSQGLPHHPHSRLRHPNHHRHHPVNNYSSKSAFTKPNQPNARAYLRHMASAPNIQPLVKRPSLSEASLRSHALERGHRKGMRRTFVLHDEESVAESDHEPRIRITTDENERHVHPPLPRNWIESVAKALLSGVGGPAAVASDVASTRTVKSASTRKSSALSDTSDRGERGRPLTRGAKPPLLCMQVQDVKASTSEGQVSCTRVMCRSTPTSRANSRVRSSAYDARTLGRSNGKRREEERPKIRRRGKDRDAPVVPLLARTKAENDDWMAPRQRYASGWGVGGSAQAYPEAVWSDESDDDDDDDDEEEGELGLDRLLVPARRQHSIQSLRKHLQRHPSQRFGGRGTPRAASPRSGRTSPFVGAATGRPDRGDASWGSSRGQEWVSGQREEGEDRYSYAFSGSDIGSGRPNTKWRRALPGLAQWTTSS